MPFLVDRLVKLALPLVLPVAAWAMPLAPLPAGEPLAQGVIVQLKASREQPFKESPQHSLDRLRHAFERKSQALGTVRSVGASAHWVRWTRALSATESRQLVEELQQDPEVEWAVPNVYEHRLQAAAPNDPEFSNQWWLSGALADGSRGIPNIFAAWSINMGAATNVAVLDTGLVRSHPDLQGPRFDWGYDLVTNEVVSGVQSSGDGDGRDADFSDPGDAVNAGECNAPGTTPSSWHGTRIAGQIGALTNNQIGVAGINPAVRVVSVRVAGKCGALVSDIVDALRWSAGLSVSGLPGNPFPARVINLSFGSANLDCRPYQATINELRSHGVLIIAAAGNEDSAVSRPGRCPGVVAVGAVNRDGFKTVYSNLGPEVTVTTVGGDPAEEGQLGPTVGDTGIVTTSDAGQTGPSSPIYQASFGTSFSTPIVSGVASLMLSVNPNLTSEQMVEGLTSRARPHVTTRALPSGLPALQTCDASAPRGRCFCTTSTCGAGLLDAVGALQYAQAPGNPPPFRDPSAPPPSNNDNSDGGGGAFEPVWLAGLALAAALAWRGRRRDRLDPCGPVRR